MDPPSTHAWEAGGPASAPRLEPSKKLWAARIIGLLAVAAFSVLGALSVDRSLDLPWDGWTGNERVGFYGNTTPTRWVCGDGHDHYSAPFWSGAVVFALPTALFWLVWPRRRRKA